MEADEFYQEAKQPGFADQMVFQIRTVNPENKGTFSRESVTHTVDLIDAFIMARIFGRYKGTGKPPKEMRIHVNVTWHAEAEELLHFGPPWFSGETDDIGLLQIDGKNRIPRS